VVYLTVMIWLLFACIKIHKSSRPKRHPAYICYVWQVFEALNYLWYHYLIRANPFRRFCPFHFYGMCNRHELISGCAGYLCNIHFTSIQGA
jgi:hypothetical protein